LGVSEEKGKEKKKKGAPANTAMGGHGQEGHSEAKTREVKEDSRLSRGKATTGS